MYTNNPNGSSMSLTSTIQNLSSIHGGSKAASEVFDDVEQIALGAEIQQAIAIAEASVAANDDVLPIAIVSQTEQSSGSLAVQQQQEEQTMQQEQHWLLQQDVEDEEQHRNDLLEQTIREFEQFGSNIVDRHGHEQVGREQHHLSEDEDRFHQQSETHLEHQLELTQQATHYQTELYKQRASYEDELDQWRRQATQLEDERNQWRQQAALLEGQANQWRQQAALLGGQLNQVRQQKTQLEGQLALQYQQQFEQSQQNANTMMENIALKKQVIQLNKLNRNNDPLSTDRQPKPKPNNGKSSGCRPEQFQKQRDNEDPDKDGHGGAGGSRSRTRISRPLQSAPSVVSTKPSPQTISQQYKGHTLKGKDVRIMSDGRVFMGDRQLTARQVRKMEHLVSVMEAPFAVVRRTAAAM